MEIEIKSPRCGVSNLSRVNRRNQLHDHFQWMTIQKGVNHWIVEEEAGSVVGVVG